MGFHPFQVDPAHLAYTILGAFTVIFGLFSLFIKERLYLGEAPIATVVGIILGPYVLKLFDPYGWAGEHQSTLDYITLEVTRVVIALGVFSVGVELPKQYMKRHWRTLFFLLGPCMIYGWLISGLFIFALTPGLTYKSALVIAACVTPTDPILAQAVVGGTFAERHVPSHIRHMLSAESGCNDGAAFPFLYIALYLTLDASPGHAVGEWFYMTWLYEVALGTLIGALLGFGARKIMQFSERKKLIDRQSYVAQYVSLAILSIGICTLLGSDDLLAAFACGTAFAWDGHFNKATEDAVFSNVVDLLFNCTAFIYIGAIIPFSDFNHFGLTVWRLIVITLCILAIRRLPVMLALYKWIPDIKTLREALFVGWFGPMGVGAIFIATLARHHIPHPEEDGDTSQVDLLQETIMPIVAMLVLASVVTHGLSIPFFVSGRRVQSITVTWSRNPSMPNNEPAWTTHTTRINNGGDVVVNRDDEEGDIGMHSRHNNLLGLHREKSIQFEDDSGGSSSNTRADRSHKSGSEDASPEPRTGTPPLMEYREGHDVIVERRDKGNDADVRVVVHKGALTTDEERKAFDEGGIEQVHKLGGDVGEPTHSYVRNDSEDAGGGGGILQRGAPLTRHSTNDSHSTNANSDDEEAGDGFVRRRAYHWNPPQPTPQRASDIAEPTGADKPTNPIHSYISADRIKKKQPESSGWRRLLRVGTTGSAGSANSHVEEGRASPDHGGYLPARSRTQGSQAGWGGRSPTIEPGEGGGIPLTQTLSRAVSFAPNAAPSSDTAPGKTNYGAGAPGFKKSSGLQMFRTTSVKDDEDAGAEEAPGASNYGSSASGFKRNPDLQMFRTSSVKNDGEGDDGPSVSFKEPKKPM